MYDYTDGRGYSLHVHPVLPGPGMEIATPKGTTTIDCDEAPNLALAVLTLGGEPESDKVLQAITLLKEHEQERARRKAEEEELWATAIRLRLAFMSGLDWDRARREIIEHDDIRERFFRMARSVRDNYPPAKPEPAHNHVFGDTPDGTCPACNTTPRTLEREDPEPSRDTRWRDGNNVLLEWEPAEKSLTDTEGWIRNGDRYAHYTWTSQAIEFPVTEEAK